MSGSSGQQTTTASQDPWSGQQPYLNDIFTEANRLYTSGAGGTYFPGSTVVPFSPDTQAGMAAIRGVAGQTPAGLPEAEGALTRTINGGQANRTDVLNNAASGGMSNPVLAALAAAAGKTTTAGLSALMLGQGGGMDVSAQDIMAAANRPTAGYERIAAAGDATNPALGGISLAGGPQNQRGVLSMLEAGQAATPGVSAITGAAGRSIDAGNEQLQKTASGEQLLGNPMLDQIYNRAAEQVRDNTNAAFSASGRYGSGAHGKTLGDSLSGLAADMYGNAYETERGRQMSAISELGARQSQDINRQTSAAESVAGFNASDLARKLQAGGAVAGVDATDAARGLDVQSLLAQLQEGQIGRQMQAGQSLAGLSQADRAAATGAATTAAGIQSDNAGRQLGAASNLAGLQQNDLSREGGLLGTLLQGQDADISRRLDAANSVNAYGLNQSSQAMSAAQLLPMLRELSTAGGRDLVGLGGMQEEKAGQEIQDLLNRWNFSQQAPWDLLGRYSGVVGGLGSLGGTTTTTGQAPQSGGILGALSGGAAGAGIGSMLGLTGPAGWALAGLGGLAGLFG